MQPPRPPACFLGVIRRALLVAIPLGIYLSGPATSLAGDSASSGPPGKEMTPEQLLKKQYYLTGDWFGLRPKLEDRGLVFDLFETYDVYGNVSGGNQRAVEYFGRTRLTLDVDLDKFIGWKDAEFYITAVTQEGPNFAKTRIGVFTNPSSIEGKQTTRLAEVWLAQKFLDGKASLKIGKIDGVAEFGLQEIGSTFMNDELNYVTNQSFTAGMPFDPAGKPGAVLTLQPMTGPTLGGIYAKFGIFAGNDDNAYLHDDTGLSFAVRDPAVFAAEIGWKTPEKSDLMPAAYKIGMHYNFGDTPRFNGTVADGNYFVYGNVSQTLLYLDNEKTRHFDAGFTLSGAPADRNTDRFEATALCRVVGVCHSRPKDEFGVGFIASNFSHDFGEQSLLLGGPDLRGCEKTVEVAYKAHITRWLTLQPDLQIVVDPRGDAGRDTVVILGLRTFVIF